MENELLSFEVSFLKGSLAEHQRRADKAEAAQIQLEQRLKKAQNSAISRAERERLELAHDDLVLLLKRLSKSPVGRILRQRPAFRELESRYLK